MALQLEGADGLVFIMIGPTSSVSIIFYKLKIKTKWNEPSENLEISVPR